MARALPTPHYDHGGTAIFIEFDPADRRFVHVYPVDDGDGPDYDRPLRGDDRRAVLVRLRDELVAELGDGADPAGVMPGNGELPDRSELDRQWLISLAAHFDRHGAGAVRTAALAYLRGLASDRR